LPQGAGFSPESGHFPRSYESMSQDWNQDSTKSPPRWRHNNVRRADMDAGQIQVLEEEHPERTAVFLYSKEKELL
jgi:hypothetical protein